MFEIRVICQPHDTDRVTTALAAAFTTSPARHYPARSGKHTRLYITAAPKPESGTASGPAVVRCAVCRTGIEWLDCPTGSWWVHARHPEDGHDAVPAAWEPGDPLPQAITAALWEFCQNDGADRVVDGPDRIAATAAAVTRSRFHLTPRTDTESE